MWVWHFQGESGDSFLPHGFLSSVFGPDAFAEYPWRSPSLASRGEEVWKRLVLCFPRTCCYEVVWSMEAWKILCRKRMRRVKTRKDQKIYCGQLYFKRERWMPALNITVELQMSCKICRWFMPARFWNGILNTIPGTLSNRSLYLPFDEKFVG